MQPLLAQELTTIATPGLWAATIGAVLALLVLDFVITRKPHEVSMKEATGWSVEREYYFNDAGGQMDRFGASIEARFLQLVGREAQVPEDGYHGAYIEDLARDNLETEGRELADLPDDAGTGGLGQRGKLAERIARVGGGIREDDPHEDGSFLMDR